MITETFGPRQFQNCTSVGTMLFGVTRITWRARRFTSMGSYSLQVPVKLNAASPTYLIGRDPKMMLLVPFATTTVLVIVMPLV